MRNSVLKDIPYNEASDGLAGYVGEGRAVEHGSIRFPPGIA